MIGIREPTDNVRPTWAELSLLGLGLLGQSWLHLNTSIQTQNEMTDKTWKICHGRNDRQTPKACHFL